MQFSFITLSKIKNCNYNNKKHIFKLFKLYTAIVTMLNHTSYYQDRIMKNDTIE